MHIMGYRGGMPCEVREGAAFYDWDNVGHPIANINH